MAWLPAPGSTTAGGRAGNATAGRRDRRRNGVRRWGHQVDLFHLDLHGERGLVEHEAPVVHALDLHRAVPDGPLRSFVRTGEMTFSGAAGR